jgi:hypothetical protein
LSTTAGRTASGWRRSLVPPFVLAEVDGAGTFDPVSLSGSVGPFYLGAEVVITESDHDFDTGPAKVRLATLDAAGNFSGFSEPQVVDLPSDCAMRPAAASTGEGRGTAGALLGLLALGFWRRSRGRPWRR